MVAARGLRRRAIRRNRSAATIRAPAARARSSRSATERPPETAHAAGTAPASGITPRRPCLPPHRSIETSRPPADPAAFTGFDLVYGAVGLAGAALASPFFALRAARDATARARLAGRLALARIPVARADARRVQLHGVSVGEVKLARAILRALGGRAIDPLVTSTTPAGIAEAARLFPDLARAVFPIDLATCPSRFLGRAEPSSIVLLELELWPTFLRAAASRRLPVAVVNGRISERSARRYAWLPELAARRLGAVSLFAMQSDAYAERIAGLGVLPDRIAVCGNAKLDGLPDPSTPRKTELATRLGLDLGAPILVGGSTHDPEEETLARATKRLREDGLRGLQLVLVPRHVDRADEIARKVAAILGEPRRLSRASEEGRAPASRVFLVDTIGDLEEIYRFAAVAFVGGSLGNRRGGQNVLEPAALGVPVLHGPDVPSFAEEARILAGAGASEVVSSEDDLVRAAGALLRDPALARSRGEKGKAALAPHRGAATRIADELVARGIL
ncbi:MAG TPA: glycosyltransferase N-terminal domain-containing protein [Planctomycetota bacterium]|nr:glycosyltransferase N-terminal domain-containing protein [Planctomycetota bacterium]